MMACRGVSVHKSGPGCDWHTMRELTWQGSTPRLLFLSVSVVQILQLLLKVSVSFSLAAAMQM